MFNNTFKILFAVLFLVFGGVLAAKAQIENGGVIKFDVSHPFVVNNKTLAAGKYSISAISMPDGATDILKLQSEDGKESMLFCTIQKLHGDRAKNTELIFDQADGIYFLTEIRTAGDDEGALVEKTGSEKQTPAAAGIN